MQCQLSVHWSVTVVGSVVLWNRYTRLAQGLDLQAMQYVSTVVRNVQV